MQPRPRASSIFDNQPRAQAILFCFAFSLFSLALSLILIHCSLELTFLLFFSAASLRSRYRCSYFSSRVRSWSWRESCSILMSIINLTLETVCGISYLGNIVVSLCCLHFYKRFLRSGKPLLLSKIAVSSLEGFLLFSSNFLIPPLLPWSINSAKCWLIRQLYRTETGVQTLCVKEYLK